MSPFKSRKQPVLSLRKAGIYYRRGGSLFHPDRFWALRDVSFDLFHGETLGILGHNGAGKTTLMRLIAGIYQPDRGEVIRTEYRASLLSLQVGFIPHLTGRENAILSGMLLGLKRKELESRMEKIISFSELEEFIDQPVHSYSTGMKARLGFGVAFQADPDILLVDEVLGVGDIDFREKSTLAMKDKIRSNKTVVIVSHSPGVMRELSDRIVWIERGKTIADGPPDEVLERYLSHRQGKTGKT